LSGGCYYAASKDEGGARELSEEMMCSLQGVVDEGAPKYKIYTVAGYL